MRLKTFLESYDTLGADIKDGHTIEAKGVKGKDRTFWVRSFKDDTELKVWVKDNDAEVFAKATIKEKK